MRMNRFVPVILALLLAGGNLRAQYLPPGSTLEGYVRDTAGMPLRGVQVTIRDFTMGARTDSAGFYQIRNVPIGVIDMDVRLIGYSPIRELGLRMSREVPLRIDLTLLPADTSLVIRPIDWNAQLIPREERRTGPNLADEFSERIAHTRIDVRKPVDIRLMQVLLSEFIGRFVGQSNCTLPADSAPLQRPAEQ